MSETILELRNVTKRFGSITAVNHVDFSLNKGEIMAILGENGSGKTSLMNIVDGIYYPDEGEILINGVPTKIASPIDANAHHIGMIHQHFKLIDTFSAIDNILFGDKIVFSFKKTFNKYKNEFKLEKNSVVKVLKAIKFGLITIALPFMWLGAKMHLNPLKNNRGMTIEVTAFKYGFETDLHKKIQDMSVSEKQTVEIIKTLYKGADILILDEPTAVLTPQETKKLFDVIREMKKNGKSVIIITHKLNEVMEISDRVTVMAKGKHIATVSTKDVDEMKLTEMMVGKKVELNMNRSDVKDKKLKLEIKNISLEGNDQRKALQNISFDVFGGEILGIAGIAGSGQKELLETIAGLHKKADGSILFHDNNDSIIDLEHKSPSQIRKLGIHLSFVPEDRLGMGLVPDLNIIDNVMLKSYQNGNSPLLNRKDPHSLANKIIKDLEVKTPSEKQTISRLSGGNVQKVLVGREISLEPSVLMTAYPVRGLDINTSYIIYNLLNKEKEKGNAVIFVGEDLDVILSLCDRVLVLNSGQITGIVDARKISKEEVGLLMTKDTEM